MKTKDDYFRVGMWVGCALGVIAASIGIFLGTYLNYLFH